MSVQSIWRGVGQKERPLASSWVSSWVRVVTLLKFITALLSSSMLWLSRLQYLLVVVFRLRRRLWLRMGVELLAVVMIEALMDWMWFVDAEIGDWEWVIVGSGRLGRLFWRVRAKARAAYSPVEDCFLRFLDRSTWDSSAAEVWRKCLMWTNVESEHVDLSWSRK